MLAILAGNPFIFGPLFLMLVVSIGGLLIWIVEGSPLAPFFRRCAGIVAPYAGSLAVLFSLFVVFVATDIWNQRDKAEAAAAQADSLRLLHVIAAGLGERGRALDGLLSQYEKGQAAADWKEPSAHRALEALQGRLHDEVLFGDAARADEVVRRAAVDALTVIRAAHRDLVAAATSRTTGQKWIATAILSVIAQMALVLVHIGRPHSSLLATMLFSIAVAFILWVTLVRIDPFSGADPVSLQPVTAPSRAP